jgi:ribosomal-protein-alanine N-acetyltransferase
MKDKPSTQTLFTDRLILRKLNANDAADIAALRSDDRVNKYLDRAKVTSIDDAHAFINKIVASVDKNEAYYWAIALKDAGKLVGTICLWNIDRENKSAELGYELHPDHQGIGIMHEAITAVIDTAFNNLGFKILTAYPKADNAPSRKTLEKHCFTRDKDLETDFYKQEGFSELVIYSLASPRSIS